MRNEGILAFLSGAGVLPCGIAREPPGVKKPTDDRQEIGESPA
ncbi:MAG: hypothetical protein PHF57_13735 [Methanoregula sp.]|nr:hypothetical protein [Methanoregula sp.]MDD5189261.1 hypothetical protein [Methanoregula sp.]